MRFFEAKAHCGGDIGLAPEAANHLRHLAGAALTRYGNCSAIKTGQLESALIPQVPKIPALFHEPLASPHAAARMPGVPTGSIARKPGRDDPGGPSERTPRIQCIQGLVARSFYKSTLADMEIAACF